MTENKIISLESLRERLAAARRKDRKIVFTNGCFDLLHVGHLRCLEFAKQQGDILVVGVNSDASVRRLKGKTRPIVSENERACLLAGLECRAIARSWVVLYDWAVAIFAAG
jgi:D-beta-D-heptose 7-phosphate kinase/D-beta-D-heptose 1-phosphate adenosyltransferase